MEKTVPDMDIDEGSEEASDKSSKTSPSGSNLGGNITNFKTSLLMWHVVNEERGTCGKLL